MLEKKPVSHFDKDILILLSKLRFRHNRITINGSSAIKRLNYFADIDMFSHLKPKYNHQELYDGLKNILFKIKNNSKCYFLELKIQLKNGDKIKIFPDEKISLEVVKHNFKDLDFVKIDLAYYLHFRFIEVSCIYQIAPLKNNIVKSLKEDIQKYFEEHKYFKMLKRYFNLNNLLGKAENTDKLIQFFNSKVGFYYVILSNIETLQLLEKYYDNHLLRERINNNLKILNLKRGNLETEKHEIEKEVNKEALSFYREHLK